MRLLRFPGILEGCGCVLRHAEQWKMLAAFVVLQQASFCLYGTLGGKAAIDEWTGHTSKSKTLSLPSGGRMQQRQEGPPSPMRFWIAGWGQLKSKQVCPHLIYVFLKQNKTQHGAFSCANGPCSITVGNKCFLWICSRVSYCRHITEDSSWTPALQEKYFCCLGEANESSMYISIRRYV